MTTDQIIWGSLITIALLCMSASGTMWEFIYRRQNQSRFWWTLNRVRAWLAIERDPGPWRARNEPR